MIDSRIPILHSFPDKKMIKIYLSSDMHVGSESFNERKWNAFEKLLQEDDAFVIFAGDQMEYATPKSKSSVYEQTMHPREQKRWWRDRLKPYAERVLCIVDGNHEFNRASREADAYPLYDIAYELGIEERYRSEGAFVDIGVGRVSRGGCIGKPWRYVFRVNHKAQNLVNYGTADGFEGIDLFVSGHTHKPMDKPLGKLVYNLNKKYVTEKTVENIVCGHFLKYGGYGERGGMRPTSQKLYMIELDGTEKNIRTIGFHI